MIIKAMNAEREENQGVYPTSRAHGEEAAEKTKEKKKERVREREREGETKNE